MTRKARDMSSNPASTAFTPLQILTTTYGNVVAAIAAIIAVSDSPKASSAKMEYARLGMVRKIMIQPSASISNLEFSPIAVPIIIPRISAIAKPAKTRHSVINRCC